MSDHNTLLYPKCTYCGFFHSYSAEMCRDLARAADGMRDGRVDEIATLRQQLAEAQEQREQADRSAKGWMETARLADTNADDYRAKLAAASTREAGLKWQCPKCGSTKAEHIPPFHYCQATGHHEQMLRAALAAPAATVPGTASLAIENARLLAIIESVQWGDREYDSDGLIPIQWYCPECDNSKDIGHASDCKIGAALAAAPDDGVVQTHAGNPEVYPKVAVTREVVGRVMDDGVAKRVREYMVHKDDCHLRVHSRESPELVCTCGLDALLRELGVGGKP